MGLSALTGTSYSSVINDDPHWFAIYTYPRHEKTVADQLRLKLVDVFLPTIRKESRWKDRRVQIDTPVFPGYVFARIAVRNRTQVLSVTGVVRMLSFGGTPAPIDDQEIERVRICLERGKAIRSHIHSQVGQSVRVRSGLLAGLEGVVVRCKGLHRLIVPITLISQSVSVEVDADVLESVPEKN